MQEYLHREIKVTCQLCSDQLPPLHRHCNSTSGDESDRVEKLVLCASWGFRAINKGFMAGEGLQGIQLHVGAGNRMESETSKYENRQKENLSTKKYKTISTRRTHIPHCEAA